MTSHMAFNVGKSASTAPVNPQIPHIMRLSFSFRMRL